MAKTYKPGFIYMKSNPLKQEIAMNIKNGRVYCEDGAQYSPQEILLFYEAGVEIDAVTHVVKRIFNGEVVKIERKMGTNDQTKPVEIGSGAGATNGSNPGEKIQGANGNGSPGTNGELDIY
jgi:hypothetical protein